MLEEDESAKGFHHLNDDYFTIYFNCVGGGSWFVLDYGIKELWTDTGIVSYEYDATWIMLGVLALIASLCILAVLIVWIIFIVKKIYAPIGSTKNYGERKPTSTKFTTYTYSTWLYVFGMTINGTIAILAVFFGGLFLIIGSKMMGTNVDLFFWGGLFGFIIGGAVLGLWGWFIAYQTRSLYEARKRVWKK